ncbi:hypothetical protein NQ317_001592 [Molorchus minor]|uniref:C2H2-type domain-containing protein n=1 Tax=Molorchus minor TaxID=1323400 RepID=A0ABQ9IWI6_9CUCU|nr:hypothetical protein NQ317_001592 [Molorchus minor]
MKQKSITYIVISQESFKLIIEYKKHLRESHKEVFPNNCKPFPNKESYKAHLDVHPIYISVTSAIDVSKSKPSLVAHNNTHNDPFSAVCGECKRGFKTMQEVKAHIKNHHRKVNRYMCDKCPKIFATKHSLVRHVQTKHEGIEIDIKCPDCDRIFKSDSGLKLHRECPVCWKRLDSQEELDSHLKNYKRPPRHKCDICNETFFRKHLLEDHVHSKHDTEKKCDNEVNQELQEELEQQLKILDVRL